MEYKNLLITGFEPFGGESINPSWEAVSRLPEIIGRWKLYKKKIPVVFEEASKLVIGYSDEIAADAILCIGQAGGRSSVTPEYVAINLRNAGIPDNKGNVPKETPVVSGAPDGLFSTAPVSRMVEAMKSEGLKGAVSYSAGTFVCNDTLYSLLWNYRSSGKVIGFIHVPYVPEQVQNDTICMSLDDICRCLIAAISCM